MIRPTAAPERRIPARQLWHRYFVIFPRIVMDERTRRSIAVRFHWMERRWSKTYRCWKWRTIDVVPAETRVVQMRKGWSA